MQESDPFNQLNTEDQKCAIDVAVATILIGMRLGADKALYDYVLTEFARSRTIPNNLAKYAIRNLGRTLTVQNWTLTIKKESGELVTSFTPEPIKDNELDGA